MSALGTLPKPLPVPPLQLLRQEERMLSNIRGVLAPPPKTNFAGELMAQQQKDPFQLSPRLKEFDLDTVLNNESGRGQPLSQAQWDLLFDPKNVAPQAHGGWSSPSSWKDEPPGSALPLNGGSSSWAGATVVLGVPIQEIESLGDSAEGDNPLFREIQDWSDSVAAPKTDALSYLRQKFGPSTFTGQSVGQVMAEESRKMIIGYQPQSDSQIMQQFTGKYGGTGLANMIVALANLSPEQRATVQLINSAWIQNKWKGIYGAWKMTGGLLHHPDQQQRYRLLLAIQANVDLPMQERLKLNKDMVTAAQWIRQSGVGG